VSGVVVPKWRRLLAHAAVLNDGRPLENPTCVECGRRFDLMDEDDASEWFYGHDCEVG